MRVGILRRGRGVRYGANTLYVRISDGRRARSYEQVGFVLARRVPGLLAAAGARPSLAAPGHAALGVRVARRGSRVRVAVNGERAVSLRGGRRRSRLLDADEGLRAGRNTLSVSVLDARRGEFSRRRVRVVMPRSVPIPGAGPSRLTVVGRALRADARRSRAAFRGSRLAYRWRLVRAPRRSHARLGGVATARPRLRPDRPGRYVLRVRVSEQRQRPVSFTARVGARFASSTDTAVITAGENVPPIGYPMDTIARQNGTTGALGVSVAGAGGGPFFGADPTKALQLVVLDRLNRGNPPTNQSFTNDPAGAAQLLTAVKGLDSSRLVIITKPNPATTEATPADAHAAAQTIDAALQVIGVPPPPDVVVTGSAGCGQTGSCSAFSAVGVPPVSPPVPGLPVAQGNVNPGLPGLRSAGLAGGDLHGFLELDSQGNFSFVDHERVTFDTANPNAPPNPTQATVMIGDQAYNSATLPSPGFFVLVLDAGSLVPRTSGTYPESAAGLAAMDQKLSSATADPTALVIAESIGAVGRDKAGSAGAWDAVASDLAKLGGSNLYFNALNSQTSNRYAQVGLGGAGGYPSDWTQVASTERSGTGRLTGLLARNPASAFYPAESRQPNQPLTGTLPGLISTPPTPSWPYRDTAGGRAADRCIAAHLTPALPGLVEDNYSSNINDDWATQKQNLQALAYQGLQQSCPGLDEQDFNHVQGQLGTEFDYLVTVRNWITNLKSPFTRDPTAGVFQIASDINNDVVPAASQNVGVDWTEVTSDVLWIVSAIPVFGEVAGPLNAISGGFALAADFADAPNGSSAVTEVTQPASNFAKTLGDQYQAALEGLDHAEALTVSDWSKLQTAALNAANSPGRVYDWAWSINSPSSYTGATNALTLAAARNAYEAVFPAKYRVYRAQQGTGSLNAQDVTPYPCVTYFPAVDAPYGFDEKDFTPFSGVKRFGGAAPVVAADGPSGKPVVEQWVYAGWSDDFLSWKTEGVKPPQPVLPSTDLLNGMFLNAQSDGAPLFNTLQFALEAYANGTSPGETVTHVKNQPGPGYSTVQHCMTSARNPP